MDGEYRVKVFKSGNSLALRLPKALGLKAGEDVVLIGHADGKLSCWRSGDAGTVLDGLYGAFSPDFMAEGRGETGQDERDWSAPQRDAAA